MFSVQIVFCLIHSVCRVSAGTWSVRQVAISNSTAQHVLRPDLFGYSVEPSSTFSFVSSNLTYNLLSNIANTIGKSPPIRIGGTTADEITIVPAVNNTSGYESSDTGSSGGNNGAAEIEVATRWYGTWSDYFPHGTDFVYCLNFHNTTSQWTNAIQEANAAIAALGGKLRRFEFGNEVDHWISSGWRNASWGTVEYTKQWRALRGEVENLPAFQGLPSRPKFQAAVFADPPEVPDQQVENDDFDIVNLTTKAGLLNDDGTISSYAVHLYPQSNCDAARIARLSLDTLSNHSILYTNVSQYIPQQRAAVAAGAPLVFGETNSVSCGGKTGVSDTFGAALWTLDYTLMSASLGIEQIYFHLGDQSQYSAFTPLPYTLNNQSLTAGIRANFYAHLFIAQLLADSVTKNLSIQAIPSANASDFSGYAVWDEEQVSQLVFLDMSVWNSTQGTTNPSTLSSGDSTYASPGTRPTYELEVATTWKEGTKVEAVHMQGPGTNAKSQVNISGLTVDPSTGLTEGKLAPCSYVVGRDGYLTISQHAADALLLRLRQQ